MPADIVKGVQCSILVAREQQWHARDGHWHGTAGLQAAGIPREHPASGEEEPMLKSKPLWV
jgi:hypothetical protein